jgi:hypothetical protein
MQLAAQVDRELARIATSFGVISFAATSIASIAPTSLVANRRPTTALRDLKARKA